MIDRKIQPSIFPIQEIDFQEPTKLIINKVPFFWMKNVPNETARLDIYFNAGKIEGTKGIASIVNGLLLSGTKKYSSIEIQEKINALGGFNESGVGMENAVVSMYCLKENVVELATILSEAIYNVSFDQKEVKEYIDDRIQQYKISMEKVSSLVRKEFQTQMFDSSSAYSNSMELEDFQSISIDKLKDFHHKQYQNGLDKIVIVGNIEREEIDSIGSLFSTFSTSSKANLEKDLIAKKGHFHIKKEGAIQSAIRIGRIVFNKTSEEYAEFLVLNTILGDYFGSRLMSNIREDKGYTYGIGSMINELKKTGYFIIGTEVNADVLDSALNEIKFELDKLQNELVSDEELELVKNYMLGQLLKSADGPYALTDLFMSVEMYDLNLDFYNSIIDQVQKITSNRIQELAKKYLNWEDMTVVTAG